MTKELLVLVFLIGFLAELSGTIAEIAPNGAATEESSPAGTSLPAYRFLDFSPDPDIWGANAQLRLGLRLFPGVDTALWLYYGAAWSEENYFRLGDGSLYRGDLQSAKDAGSVTYPVVHMPWGAGIEQGIHFNPANDRNDFNLLLAWRANWEWNLLEYAPDSLLATSQEPGRAWSLINALLLDLHYDGMVKEPRSHVRSGWTAEASAEYAPQSWSTPASTNYLQLDLALSGFLPLYELVAESGYNLFSLYLAGYTSVDGIIGLGNDARKGIPYLVSQQFGGLERRSGLGGSVRGLGSHWGDGVLKWVANVELRCNLPAFLDPNLYFGALLFVDAGAYLDPPGMPEGASFRSGFLMSSGLGVYLDFLGLGTLAVYSNFMLNAPNSQGKYWVPIGLDFGLHF